MRGQGESDDGDDRAAAEHGVLILMEIGERCWWVYDLDMAVTSDLMSVAEFSRLPEAAGGMRQELHHGELFELAPVKKVHTFLQKRLVKLLESASDAHVYGVDKEFPFRPEPEHQVWTADVAMFSIAEWNRTADDDYYHGVPTIVIEVLSPSNTASEMLSRERICMRNGGREFWLVDTDRECVRVVRAGAESTDYDIDGVLRSPYFNAPISVREIFAR